MSSKAKLGEVLGIVHVDVPGLSSLGLAEQERVREDLTNSIKLLLRKLRVSSAENTELQVFSDSIQVIFFRALPTALEFAVSWFRSYERSKLLAQGGLRPRLAVHAGVGTAHNDNRDAMSFWGPVFAVARSMTHLGDAGDVLISKPYYDLAAISPQHKGNVKIAGTYEVDNNEEVILYYYFDSTVGNPAPPIARKLRDERGNRIRRASFPSISLLAPDLATRSFDSPGLRVVALAAHANDLAWGAAGMILKLIHEHKASVHCHFITSNTWERYVGKDDYGQYSRAFDAVSWVASLYLGSSRILDLIKETKRLGESRAASALLKEVKSLVADSEIVHVDGALPVDAALPAPAGGFRDGRLIVTFDSLLERLDWLRNRYHPDVVLAPSTSDNHSDHRSIAEATLQIFKEGETLLHYHLPHVDMPGKGFRPSLFLSLNSLLRAPWNTQRQTAGEIKLDLFRQTMSNDRHRWRMSPEALAIFMTSFSIRGMCAPGASDAKASERHSRMFEAFESVVHLE